MSNHHTVTQRCSVNEADTWDLSPLFQNTEAFEKSFNEAERLIPLFSDYKGTIAASPEKLYYYLNFKDELSLLIDKLYSYAFQLSDTDTAESAPQAMKNRVLGLYSRFYTAISWESPELLTLTDAQLDNYCMQKPELHNYLHYIKDTLRQKSHILSESEEQLLALSSEMSYGPQNIFSMFNNADLHFPSVDDGHGEQIEITHGRFITLLESDNRDVRKAAFQALYATYDSFKNTLAATFSANVKKELFYAKARRYTSTLEAHLDGNNIPVSVYTQLIESVRSHLPSMYRYVRLRKKLLGVEELHMYDVYTPLVTFHSPYIPFEAAKQTVLEGLSILGEDYTALLKDGFDHRWIDIYENKGKRSGAYSTCVYGTHPYVLLNYQGNLDNVFTLAHEMGHALHSCYTNAHQTYINSNYNIFVAEIASTCNEYILIRHLIRTAKDQETKIYLLNHLLDQFKGTLFRQTMFADFEKKVHEAEASQIPLTADWLCSTYKQLNEDYFGPDMISDPEIAMEWARIPHFYSPFYVYQYATGLSAAIAFGQKILDHEPNALENYKRFLSGGCSTDCIDLLKSCGIDMTSPAPVNTALEVFTQCLDELEKFI